MHVSHRTSQTMSSTLSRVGLAGLACLSLSATASRAADWDGSYAADGRCFCSGTLAPAVSSRIVPTPRGGQSVATVCSRIGDGPGLSEVNGRFDRVVYRDAQCGNGPGSTVGTVEEVTSPDGATDAATDCSGTMEPGADDCHAIGPRWDLGSAYAGSTRRAVEASVAQMAASVMGAPAVVPVMGAATSAPSSSDAGINIVEIDGRRWREAPPGTPESGPAGSRIILDGKVFLDVELASESDFTPKRDAAGAPASRAAAARPKPATANRKAAAPTETLPASTAARRDELLAEARERLKQREADTAALDTDDQRSSPKGPSAPSVAAAEPAADTPETMASADAPGDSPTLGAASEPSGKSLVPAPIAAPATPAGADAGARASADAPAAGATDSDAVKRSAEAIADNDGDDTASPFMQALRMPSETRASSREFGYVDAMPASWDFGGGGLMLEGSAPIKGGFRALARVGAASEYQELLLGGSWFKTPARADRLTMVLTAGVETGRFELDGVRSGRRVDTDLADTGVYLGAGSRFVVNRRFELQAGVGFSSFFEGDPTVFGGAYFHVGRQLDVVSRVEIGDNDSLGIGVRYYY